MSDYLLHVSRDALQWIENLVKRTSTTTLALSAGSALCLVIWYMRAKGNDPPGPRGWPYVGNLPAFISALGRNEQMKYTEQLHDEYGPIVSFKAGVQRFVFVNDSNLIKEIFKRDEFAVRPTETLPLFEKISHGEQAGILFSNGETNTEMRRFALLTLRDFGVGKSTLDDIIRTEAQVLTHRLEAAAKENHGIVSNIKPKCQMAAANVIHSIALGFRYDYDDPKWKEVLSKLLEFFSINFLSFPVNYFPVIDYIPFLREAVTAGKLRRFLDIDDYLRKYVSSIIEDHRSTYIQGEIRDFLDLFIKYEGETREFYTTTNIFGVIMDLFRAGTDSTATSLSWCIMYLAKFPHVHQQVSQEIDEVIGDQVFNRKDKDKLPKTRAFINEVLRYVSIGGFSAPHTVSQPTKIGGYTVYPGTIIFANIYAIHHDKNYWKDPENFRIERWIGNSGELLSHDEHFIPFSTGKRACPGKQIARIELILFLVELLQKFTFEKPEGMSDFSDDQDDGVTRAPKDFHVKITPRE